MVTKTKKSFFTEDEDEIDDKKTTETTDSSPHPSQSTRATLEDPIRLSGAVDFKESEIRQSPVHPPSRSPSLSEPSISEQMIKLGANNGKFL